MPGLYSVKPWFLSRMRPVEDALVARRVSPDSLTLAAVAVSVVTGAAIALGGALHVPLVWLAVPPLVLARLALNALDGSVARRTRTARPFGTALNEIGDRVGDAATVGGTAFVARPGLALGAVAACFLTSLSGVLVGSLTGRRDSSGPMGKADRMALVALGAAVGALAGSVVPFAVVCWTLVAGCIATVAMRLARLHESLRPVPFQALFAESLVDVPAPALVEREDLDALVR